ncbi:NADase-type glycan-binding domain-containing protein [Streptomyces sp. NPDC048419]|uniref:NADase-type glycan-binding domain-containing protein n=1 Tax=Streptomyces sp. NPDC048419 TaxID=3365547 RepID=UPI0037218C50
MTTTHNCADCGTRAEPGQSFCDACGAVLSWTDRAAAASAGGGASASGPEEASVAATPAVSASSASGPTGGRTATAAADATLPAPVPRAEPATPAAPQQPQDAHPNAAHPTAAPTDDTAPTEPVPAVAATTPLPTASPAPADPGHPAHPAAPEPPEARTAAAPEGMTDRARQLLVPVADPEPRPAAEPSVAPVLPGRPAPQRPQTVRAPGEELGADGGTPCPWCSTRNRPDRHYCTRCAMPMAGEAQTPGRLPWWRRLFGAGSRETPWAGDRPRLRRTFDRVLTWLGAAIVLTLLIVLGFNIPKGVQATKDHFSKRAAVEPDSWSASRSYPGHKPDLAGDKLNNTWWGPGVSETGEGQWLQAKFDVPTRLLDLIITPGVSTRPDQITQSARPHRLQALITLSNGKTTKREVTLDPGAGGQRIPFRVGTVSSVRFTIESASGTSSKKQVAIAEIEFFGPSSANSA